LPVSELQAVLFDMDGTLVETESLWQEAEVLTMAAYGSTWSDEEQHFALGGPFGRVVEYMAQKAHADPTDVAVTLVDAIDQLMSSRPLPIQPGIAELLAEARAAGLATGLVTNSFRRLISIVLKSTGLQFDVTVAGDELPENKPHPMPYEFACRSLGVDPVATVVLEDSMTGIASATAAGCFVVAIPHMAVIDAAPRQLIVPSAKDVSLGLLLELLAQ